MDPSEITILVTGADGFVGTHLCRSLLLKYQVYAFIRPSRLEVFKKKIADIDKARLKIIVGEFNELFDHRDSIDRVTHVVHCAGTMLGAFYKSYEDGNLNTTKELIKYLPKTVKKFIFLSSQGAVGPSHSLNYKMKPSDPPKPISHYGETKLLAEKEVLSSGLPAIIFRPASILGPEDISFFEIFKMADRGKFPILGQKIKYFQFINVFDVVSAIELVLFSELSSKIYHIAQPSPGTWDTMRTSLETHLKRPIKVLYLNYFFTLLYFGFFDLRERITGKKVNMSINKLPEFMASYWLIDESEFTRDTGFLYTYTLDETIKMTLSWYRQNKWLN